MPARPVRSWAAVLVASAIVPLSAPAASSEEPSGSSGTIGVTGVYRGFAVDDTGGDAPAVLDLTTHSGGRIEAALVVGDTGPVEVTGQLTEHGAFTLTGGSSSVLVHGRLRPPSGTGHPPVAEARVQVQRDDGPRFSGTLAVVRQRAETQAPAMTAVWEGTATPATPPPLSLTIDVTGEQDGTLAADVTLGDDVFTSVGQADADGAFAVVGRSASQLVVATGTRQPGADRWTLPGATGELRVLGTDPGSMAPPTPTTTASFQLGARPHPPTFTVDAELVPHRQTVPAHADGAVRPVARFTDDRGGDAEFVADELLLRTADAAELAAFLTRWGGTVLRTIDTRGVSDRAPQHVVRVDPSRADEDRLPADLQALDVRARGAHRVSSREGRQLLAAAAAETRAGLQVGLNWLMEGHSHLVDRVAAEASSGPGGDSYDPNAFTWWHLRDDDLGAPGIGTAEAWRLLDIAHRTTKVPIAVVDGGFWPGPDLPEGATGAIGLQNPMLCTGGTPCPWHGTTVAQTAAAQVDNRTGTAGTGGLVADLRMYHVFDGTRADGIESVYRALDEGARIVNVSLGSTSPAVDALFDQPWDDVAEDARAAGALLFASAGNDGIDVDAVDCTIVCGEAQITSPCEDPGTICVGGTADRATTHDMSSNFGYESCLSARCDVDLWAPFRVYVGSAPDAPGDRTRVLGGTSYSSPYVAGVAALVWAANPALSNDDVEWVLHHTAIAGSGFATDIVDAEAAVRHVLPAHNAPTVVIDAPADGAEVLYGDFNQVAFTAGGHDVDGGCCTYRWVSSVDGFMGNGQTLSYGFPTPGERQVTVTATDATGRTDHTFIRVTADNGRPTTRIWSPRSTDTLYAGAAYTLSASVTDPNELTAPCSYLRWTSDNGFDSAAFGGSFPATGCNPTVTFRTAGPRTLLVEATDAYGARHFDWVTVQVSTYAPGAAPLVSIVSPADGSAHQWSQEMTLDGSSLEDGDPATYRWVLERGDDDVVVAETLDAVWRPSDTLLRNCGGYADVTLRLEGTDKDGTTTDEAVIDLLDGPC